MITKLLFPMGRLVATPGAQPPLRRLPPPDAEFREPFTSINGLRELSDGRIHGMSGLSMLSITLTMMLPFLLAKLYRQGDLQ